MTVEISLPPESLLIYSCQIRQMVQGRQADLLAREQLFRRCWLASFTTSATSGGKELYELELQFVENPLMLPIAAC